MKALRKLSNLKTQVTFALILALLLPTVAGAATVVNDTFADGESLTQNLSANSVRIFNGRAGTVRTDAAGSVNFNISAAGGSEGFWGFFTDSGQPITLGVGDRLTVSARFTVQNIGANAGADLRFGLFDSKGTRTTANTTGGLNSPSFSDDPGYATRLAGTAASATPPFTLHRRSTPSATDPLANVISTTVAEYTALSVTGGSARAPLSNNTPYTLAFTVERVSATDTKVSVSVTDGGSFNLNSTATESSQTPATTFDWFGFRVPNGFASDIAFTRWSADYTPAAPVITAHPQPSNLTVSVGSNVTMSVAAAGNGLSYQWLKNGAPVANGSATTPTLSITNAQLSDTGSYTAVVSNAGGSVSSNPVSLTVADGPVAPPPTITAEPAATTVTVGTPTSLSVAAEGESLFYQWYKNGALIPGANNASLDFAAAQVADAGNYHVVVSNSGGNVTSATARLLVVSSMTANGFSPAFGASGVNIDALPSITFDQTPKVGTSGKVHIFRASDNALVDTIDLGVDTNTGIHAPGPQSARQIGGSSFNFNYHPVIIDGNTATIYPKVKLAYGQTYYVMLEPGVVTDAAGAPFVGVSDASTWTFSTKDAGPAAGTTELTVAADGTGDFSTVQGAIDFVPTNNTQPVTINVRRGTYTEIVYIRSSKPFITVRGEDRNESIIRYSNNENLNTGSSPRAVFGVDATDFTLENITIHNTTTRFNSENRTRQSEAFRGNNHRILLNRVNLKSFQDTLLLQNQSGSNQGGFVNESYIEGDIDFLWGTGVVYFRNSEFKMVSSNAYYTQIRNDATKNGYVFVNSRLTAAPGVTGAYLSRIDPNVFPYSQVVFIDSVMGGHIRPEAWRLDNAVANATSTNYPNLKFWEYNTRDENGNPVDVSQRHPVSRQITTEEADFWRNPANVLGGWVPELGTSATISLAGLNQTYTGSPLGVSVITEPAGIAVQLTYNGSDVQPTEVGSYEVVATITEPGYAGTATGTLVIGKATAAVTLGDLAQTHDGSPKAVSVVTEPAGLNVEVTYNGSPSVPSEPGTYTVTATINDANYEGSATGTLTINSAPNTQPVLNLPTDLTVEATGPEGAAATFAATATDAEDGEIAVMLSHESGSTFPLGTTTVTANATDAAGATVSGSFKVNVIDTTAPVISTPANIVLEATSPEGAVAVFGASATDTVGGEIAVSFSHQSGSTFPVGTTTVTVTGVDASGNTATATFTVTVRAMNTPPVLNLPANIVAEATSGAGAAVNFAATAVDAEDGQLPVTLSLQSGSTFALGTTTVTATARDSKGLTTTGTFNVTVRDTTAPVFQSLTASPAIITKANNKMVPVVISANVSDAVDSTLTTRILSVTGSEDVSGDWQVTGNLTLNVRAERSGKTSRVYHITVESRDDSGNASTGTVTVTVR
ncbi:MAG TPA: pectinesterase family protein [Pyrinomonadaceae bacterium]|nr:pectinesterase family protein [Pyrinomonadaceae bacterium]